MANRNRVTIVINADGTAAIKSFGRVEEKTRGLTGKIKEHWLGVSAAILGVYMAAKKLNDLGGSFIQAADSAEQYRVRLTTLLGSVEEGNRLFDAMAGYASKVPYEYEQIMGAATSLSGVMKGGVDEVKRWMPLIGDLAAASGLTIEETTSQVIRMYSAGAASADLFRERGILAMLGFQAGVSYSAEETQEKMFEAWEKADSKFRGATDSLAGTWSGLMSMFSDLWFKFRNMVMDAGAFDRLKEYFRGLKERIDEAFRTGEAEVWAERISELMVAAMRAFELMGKAAGFAADNIDAIALALSVAAIIQAPALIMSIAAAVKAMTVALAANPAMWVAVAGAVAVFVGYKLGEYLWGINKEMDRLKEIMAAVRGEQEYLNERAKKYSGLLKELGYSTVQELTKAIKEGEVIWDESLKKWINPERERKRAEEAAAARLEVEKQNRAMMEYSNEIYAARELDFLKKTIAQEEEWERQSDERLIAHLEEQRRIRQENLDMMAYAEAYFRAKDLADEEAKNELKKQSILGTFNAMTQMANAFYQLSGKQSKSAFKVYKALALAETIIGTYYAAQKAYESQFIPGDPTSLPRAVAAAVAATAAGLARVAAIRSQTMGGGASVGGASGGGSSGGYGSAPEAPRWESPYSYERSEYGSGFRPGESQQGYQIVVHGDVYAQDSEEFKRKVVAHVQDDFRDPNSETSVLARRATGAD